MARAIVISAGPLATASDNKIGASQKAAGSQYLVLNGAAGVATANNICTSQTPSGAGALTLNGSLASTNPVAGFGGTAAAGAAQANLATPSRIYLTCTGNESGNTFTIVGTLQGVGTFGPGIVQTETLTGPNASIISSANIYSIITSITISGAAANTITVGTHATATLDNARRVQIKSAGDDSGITFAIVGADAAGNARSETLTGANTGSAYSVLDYYTITSVKTSAAVTSTVQIGTNNICSSPWARMDEFGGMGPVSVQVDGSGTVNWTMQTTLNDPNSTSNPIAAASVNWINWADTALVGSTVTTGVQGSLATPPKFVRVLMNSNGGATAYAAATVMQVYQK